MNDIRHENTKKRGTGRKGTYLACLACLLRDICSRLDTMGKEEPLDVNVCGTIENGVDFRCFKVV